jgi:hypothetical protein
MMASNVKDVRAGLSTIYFERQLVSEKTKKHMREKRGSLKLKKSIFTCHPNSEELIQLPKRNPVRDTSDDLRLILELLVLSDKHRRPKTRFCFLKRPHSQHPT